MKLVRKLLLVAVVISMITAGIFFAGANDAAVPLNLLFHTFQPKSLALWVLGSFALGGVVGMLVSSAIMLRLRASLSASRRQLQRTETELNGLREGQLLKETV